VARRYQAPCISFSTNLGHRCSRKKCQARKEFRELEAEYHSEIAAALKPNIRCMMKQLQKENDLDVYIPDDDVI